MLDKNPNEVAELYTGGLGTQLGLQHACGKGIILCIQSASGREEIDITEKCFLSDAC